MQIKHTKKHKIALRLAQQMTLSDLEWPLHESRAICAVAELLAVIFYASKCTYGHLCLKKNFAGVEAVKPLTGGATNCQQSVQPCTATQYI